MKTKYLAPSTHTVEVSAERIICDSNRAMIWTLTDPFTTTSPANLDWGREGYGSVNEF